MRAVTLGTLLGLALLSTVLWRRGGIPRGGDSDLLELGQPTGVSEMYEDHESVSSQGGLDSGTGNRAAFEEPDAAHQAESRPDRRASSLLQERTSRMLLPRGFASAADYARDWSGDDGPFPEPWLTRLQLMIDSYNSDLEAARSQVISAQHAFLEEDVRLRDAGVAVGTPEAKQLVQAAKRLGEGFVAHYSDPDPNSPNRVLHLLPGADAAVDSAYDDLWAVVDQGQAAILRQLQTLP